MADERDARRRENTHSRRSARVRQMTADRDARRRGDTESRRSARVQQTADERDARRHDNTERRAAQRDKASRPDWTHLLMHARPSPCAIRLRATHLCSHCGARLLWKRNHYAVAMVGSPLHLSLPCLMAGKRCFGRLPSGHSRKCNNLFAFTAMGVSGDEGFVHQPVPSCVKINGRTYHCVLPAEWYVHDPDQRRVEDNSLSLSGPAACGCHPAGHDQHQPVC